MTKQELKKIRVRSELKKIDPELISLRSMKSEKVKVIVYLNGTNESLEDVGDVTYEYEVIPAVAMEIPANQLETLAKESNVEKIVLDRKLTAFRSGSVPLIRADVASSNFSVNGSGINISIVDTGVFNHTEFQSRIISQKCYCTNCCPPNNSNETSNATDDNSHGTHVAGIAAGQLGVANASSIIAVKVLDSSGSGYDSDVARGIEWAFLNGANIISLSLGGCVNDTVEGCYDECYDSPSARMVERAVGNGTVVVVAAGNCGPGGSPSQCPEGVRNSYTISTPGCAKGVITVGATNSNDDIASFSSRGPTDRWNRTKPDLTAPGISINSTSNSANGYATKSGTSQATPHVAGIAALLIQEFNRTYGYFPDPNRVKTILITAVNITGMNASGYEQRNNVYGSGRVDAYQALSIINFTKNNTISVGEGHHYKINVNSSDLKMTLYWPENENTNNDLNLFVGNGAYNYSNPTNANDTVEQLFLMNATTGYWNVYVVAASGTNQTYYLASNFNITDDVTAPALILEYPQNRTYTNRTGIPLNFTTDSTNQTIWYKLDGVNETNITGNTTFNVSSDGFHNITLYVNDSYNNINQTTQYFSVDTISPIITVISPNSTTVSNYTTKTIWFNISLDETGNVSLFSIDASGNVSISRLNNTYFYNQSTVTEGMHNVTFYVNDSSGFSNSSSVNFTISIVPVISNQTVDKSLVLLNEGVNISANISDDNIAFALVNITWPNGNYTSQNMTNSSLYYSLFNDTNQTGVYNVLMLVNDTLGNAANTSLRFDVGQGINVSSRVTNGTSAINMTIKIFYNGTSQVRNQTTNTSFGFILPSGLWDIFVNTSQLNLTLYDSNITQNSTRQINMSDNVRGNFTADVNAIKTFAAKFENFNFSLVNLSFDFNSSLVQDAVDLKVYRCTNWSFTSSNCSTDWTRDANDLDFNATIGSNNVVIVSSNLSAFSLGETIAMATTTIPSTTTVSSSGSSGSATTTTSSTTTTVQTTTTYQTTTSSASTTVYTTTIIYDEGNGTSVKTAWYLVLIPVFAVVGLIVWFMFSRKLKLDEFEKLKDKWTR